MVLRLVLSASRRGLLGGAVVSIFAQPSRVLLRVSNMLLGPM